VSGRRKTEFIQFQDWMARMYPSEGEQPEDGKRLLSRTFTFQVTDSCNLACTYCYQVNKGKRRMPFETAKLAVDKLLSGEDGFYDYINPEISEAIIIEFIGGEPLLEVELIDRIVDYFRERAIELDHPWAEKYCISICSNGVLYSDPKVQKFLQKNARNLSFSVTVDGTKELHDSCRVFPDGKPSYDLAHHAAMDWVSRGYYMGSKITVAPANVQYLAECLKQMVLDGYHEINCNTVYEIGWGQEHATVIYWQVKKFIDWFHERYDAYDYAISYLNEGFGCPKPTNEVQNWCGGTGVMLSVDPDGRLFPCIRYMESSLASDQPPLVIGDVWNGLARRPAEQRCLECMAKVDRRTQSTDECFFCPIADGCAWCSAYNYQVNGTVDRRVTYSCEMHKARALSIVYYWNTYHRLHQDGEVKDLWVPKQWAVPIIGEEEYQMLVNLTKSLGGFVNEDATMVETSEVLEGSDCKNAKILSRE